MACICRLCGKNALEIGGFLARVNPKGEAGIWECRPSCGADLPQETKILMAIEGDDKGITKADKDDYYKSGGLHPCYD